MPTYSFKSGVNAGLPLGGIGAGKMEILPNGLFNAFTFQNNWSAPIHGTETYPGILGYHLGFFSAKINRNKTGRLKSFFLQTEPILNYPTIQNIVYDCAFTKFTLFYQDPRLGAEITLEAYASFFPGDVKRSSLPIVFFDFKIKNHKPYTQETALLFIGRNLSGAWCVGRQNRVFRKTRWLDLEFMNTDTSRKDFSEGWMRFRFMKDDWDLSFIESWNSVKKNFVFDSQNITLSAWDYFSKEGRLPNLNNSQAAMGENQELCGAVSAAGILKPQEERRVRFSASWYYPTNYPEHYYQNKFKNIKAVSDHAVSCRAEVRSAANKLQELVYALPFPSWFNEALLTSFTPFYAASWLTQDKRFVFYEAPIICPLMGTLDVGFYGSIPLAYFYPELELSQIRQFAAAQRPDGYVPHDLGRQRIDLPSNGTTFYQWKDLNPKFVLMIYRDYLWTKDLVFLKAMYPHVKKAIDWILKTDHDGNGLPDHEGADQTFDLWNFKGASPYTASLLLAALLASEKMALLMNDKVFLEDCRANFLKGSRSLNQEFWNGDCFGDPCALSQLNGQWYADLLSLGDIVAPEKIKRSLETILRLNGPVSKFGMINSVYRNGRIDQASNHSKNIWIGMNYAYVCLALMRGLPMNELLKQARKVWDNVANVQKNPWSQPDMIDAKNGKYLFGDHYYRNMAIWSIPIAYANVSFKTKTILKTIQNFKKGLGKI